MSTPGNRIPVNIEDEMRHSYLDYAMSVIIGRALPDVRDGLKPAHRRVLFAMRQMGLASNRAYRKCAKIVGEVIGNYHPHGDAPAYDTLVRLAQDFNMRKTLVDGQGNFGSVDGDPPAAYRYTEARLESAAEAMMEDLDKDTVDYVPNFDETTTEPTVLPTLFPNLLVNGSTGIAVGMATNIPPHNLREVIEGVIWIIEKTLTPTPPGAEAATFTREQKLKELLKLIPGPDFPTGGQIVGRRGIHEAYITGRGGIQVRAKAEIEPMKKGDRQQIIVTEIPYQVNKTTLLLRIRDVVQDKTIEGISDLRDESDRDGMRIVIELKRGEVGEVILNNLYKHTQLQQTFGIIMLAIDAGRPKVLGLLEIIERFIDFRRDVVRRRIEFELRKAEARAHILEGLRIALDRLDAVITLIRQAKNPPEAKAGLVTQFGLSEIQAQAILDMQLQRLTGLERQKILDELAQLRALIDKLRGILASQPQLLQIIVDELRAAQTRFADARRTLIIEEEGELSIEDLIADEDVAVTVTDTGYIKRTPISTYRNQRRGGKGRIGMRTRDEDVVNHLFVASTHSYMMIFSDRGRAYWLKVHEIPDVGADGKGKAIANLVQMEGGEKIAAMLAVQEFDEQRFIVMGTRNGTVKKTELSAFANPRAGGIIAMGVEEGDSVMAVQLSDGASEVFIGSRDGMAIRFPEDDVRGMGRSAYGVRGIQLREGDRVVAMEVVKPGGTLLTVTEKGYAKRTDLDEYRVQGRGGFGLKNLEITDKNGPVVRIAQVHENEELLVITEQGKILRTPAADIRTIGRATQGVRLMELEGDDRVVSVALVDRDEEVVDSGAPPAPEPEPGPEPEPDKGVSAMSRVRAAVSVALLLAPLATLAIACSRPPEQQLLTQFFRAARNRDNNTTAMMSAVPLDPREQGAVEDFSITTVGPEQRAPLTIKALMAAEATARTAEAEFRKTKLEYQNANIKTLEQLIKLEPDPTAKLTPEQQVVKTAWAKWTEDTRNFARATSEARRAIVQASGTIEASLTQPNQPAFDPKTFDGEMVRKDVTVAANFKDPAGATSQKNLVVTLERASGTQAGARREGRWMITKIAGI